MIRKVLVSIAIILIVVICLAVFGCWQFERSPVSGSQIQSLRVGMSGEEVLSVLGRPNVTNETAWFYSVPMGWSVCKVRFDDHHKVLNWELDR